MFNWVGAVAGLRLIDVPTAAATLSENRHWLKPYRGV